MKSVIQDSHLSFCVPITATFDIFCTDVIVLKEFEIELEGSQYLRILCYEKCYDKSMLNKDDNEIVDKIMGKGQVQVRKQLLADITGGDILRSLGDILISCLMSAPNRAFVLSSNGPG